MSEQLTDAGRKYAETHGESIVCRVALHGDEGGWPPAFVETSIKLCNEEGERGEWEFVTELVLGSQVVASGKTQAELNAELDEQYPLGSCVICGEQVSHGDDPAEMHDPAMYDLELTEEERLVASEREPNQGVCHAQCGLDRGWVVS